MKIEKWQAQFREEMKSLTKPISKLMVANEKETNEKSALLPGEQAKLWTHSRKCPIQNTAKES